MSRSNKIAALVVASIFGLAAVAVVLVVSSAGIRTASPVSLVGATVVTRDEVLAHWAKMPAALAVSPTELDKNADRLCARIRQDSSAADLIANAEQLDRANGGGGLFREHLRLMVGYRCPEHVTHFEQR